MLKDLYIDSKNVVYMSIEDVNELFDNTVYYYEKNSQIITSSDTKVAVLNFENNEMQINNVEKEILAGAIKKDNIIYIPISEMEIVYNIKIEYIKDSNIVAIENLNRGMIVANVKEETDLKYKPKGLSKNVTKLEQGEKVNCFDTTSKGWRQIKTEKGQVRIFKGKQANK